MSSTIFAQALCQLIDKSPGPQRMKDLSSSAVSETSERLMKAFLAFGSETDDNMNCFRHVEYGPVDNLVYRPNPIYGLKLKGKKILISDVIHSVGDLKLPTEIAEEYPDLTEDEWSAITRMATMVLLAFEQYNSRVQRM